MLPTLLGDPVGSSHLNLASWNRTVPRFWRVTESSGGPVKIQVAGSHPENLWFPGSGWSQRMCFSDRFPGDNSPCGSETALRESALSSVRTSQAPSCYFIVRGSDQCSELINKVSYCRDWQHWANDPCLTVTLRLSVSKIAMKTQYLALS